MSTASAAPLFQDGNTKFYTTLVSAGTRTDLKIQDIERVEVNTGIQERTGVSDIG